MDERVWVGAAAETPAGWIGFDSVDAFLASTASAVRIVVDDPAAVLRESDFLRLFERSPLARIERVVGPWRAGVGRTDPAWPLLATQREFFAPSPAWELQEWWPPTGGYEELVTPLKPVDLAGLSVVVQIDDHELRETWNDSLVHSGAELVTDGADVLIQTGSEPRPVSPDGKPRLIVQLCADPWNAERPLSSGESQPPRIVITASILDSPAVVMNRVVQRLK